MIPIATGVDKVNLTPGFYRGVLGGYNLEILCTDKKGNNTSVRTVEGIRGVNYAVIVSITELHEVFAYDDESAKNEPRNHGNVEEAISADYLKKLVAVRKQRIGPAIARLNGVLIEKVNELERTGVLIVATGQVMDDIPMDNAERVMDAFRAQGFKIELRVGHLAEQTPWFEIRM